MPTRRELLALSSGAAVAAATAGLALPNAAHARQATTGYVATEPGPGRFPLVAGGRAAPIVVSAADHAGVLRVVDDLRDDIRKVTGVQPVVGHDTIPAGRDPVIVGTIGKS